MLKTAVVPLSSIRPPTGRRRPSQCLILAPSCRGRHEYEVIAGHLVLQRAIAAGAMNVTAMVRDAAAVDSLERLVEHGCIKYLTPMQEAVAIDEVLRSREWTQVQLAESIFARQPHISRRRGLLRLSAEDQLALEVERITVSEAEGIVRARGRRSPHAASAVRSLGVAASAAGEAVE